MNQPTQPSDLVHASDSPGLTLCGRGGAALTRAVHPFKLARKAYEARACPACLKIARRLAGSLPTEEG